MVPYDGFIVSKAHQLTRGEERILTSVKAVVTYLSVGNRKLFSCRAAIVKGHGSVTLGCAIIFADAIITYTIPTAMHGLQMNIHKIK